jgi:hypothetical protein
MRQSWADFARWTWSLPWLTETDPVVITSARDARDKLEPYA